MKKAQPKLSKASKQPSKKSPAAVARKAAPARSIARARNAPAAGLASPEISALDRRLQNLEDILEITRLKDAYCDAVDGGWNRRTHRGEEVASLFVEDGVWDAGEIGGRGEGHQGIVNRLNTFSEMPFAFHRVTNPDIRVNGDRATGMWHIIAYLCNPDGTPVMYFGVYHDEFVRTPRGWKFKLISADAANFCTLREGWSKGEYYKAQAASASAPENSPNAD